MQDARCEAWRSLGAHNLLIRLGCVLAARAEDSVSAPEPRLQHMQLSQLDINPAN